MYRRCDKDCNPTAPQPASVVVTDVFGNSFRNWCVDYIGTDKDCAPDGTTGCAPQITVVWTRHLSDNSDGATSPYNKPPLGPLPGGFTDGDRAVCFLSALGASKENIKLLGTRSDIVGRWSGDTEESSKLQKLQWMKSILEIQGFGVF